jgi:hypothetical protein
MPEAVNPIQQDPDCSYPQWREGWNCLCFIAALIHHRGMVADILIIPHPPLLFVYTFKSLSLSSSNSVCVKYLSLCLDLSHGPDLLRVGGAGPKRTVEQ